MYVIDYNDFTLQNDDNHTITKLDALGGIPIRISEDPLTGGDGGNIWEQMYDMRTIEINGMIFSADFDTYYSLRQDMLIAFTPRVSRLFTLTLSDGTQKQIYAKVVLAPVFKEIEGEIQQAEYQVILKAQDPFWQDTTLNQLDLTLATGGGSPVSSPVSTPVGGTSGDSGSLVNTGSVYVYPRVIFTGSVVSPTLTNTSTGEVLKLNTTLALGQQIEIYHDTTGLYVKDVATGVSYMQYLQGTLFPLPVGTTTVRFSSTTYDANATCTITWTTNYIGV